MTTLTDLVQHPVCVSFAGGILPQTARFEGPQNLCNAATLGGLIALAEPDSELFAALLALEAIVVAVTGDETETASSFENFISSRPHRTPGADLIIEMRLPLAQFESGHARIARTPMDRCIVAAVAIQGPDGVSSQFPSVSTKGVRIGLCGVGTHPLMSDNMLNPPDDFKGSAEECIVIRKLHLQPAASDARGRSHHRDATAAGAVRKRPRAHRPHADGSLYRSSSCNSGPGRCLFSISFSFHKGSSYRPLRSRHAPTHVG